MPQYRRVDAQNGFSVNDDFRRQLREALGLPELSAFPQSTKSGGIELRTTSEFGEVRGILNHAWQRIRLVTQKDPWGWHLGVCTSKRRREFTFGTSQPKNGEFVVNATHADNPFLFKDTNFLLKGRMGTDFADFSPNCPIRGRLSDQTQKTLHDGLSRLGQLRRQSGQRRQPWNL